MAQEIFTFKNKNNKLSNFNISGRAKLNHVFRIETDQKEMDWHLLLSPQEEVQHTKNKKLKYYDQQCIRTLK